MTVRQILAWADAHHRRTGRWPRRSSGPIPETDGETWAAVVSALRDGYRGLRGGTTLYRLLRKHRKVSGRLPNVRARKERTGRRGPGPIRINLPPEVLRLVRAGELTPADVAQRYGVSLPIACRELRRLGVKLKPRKDGPRPRPAWETEVIRRYRAGETMDRIAGDLGVSQTKVASALRRNGVATRPPRLPLFDDTPGRRARLALGRRVRALREERGLTQEALAERAGLHPLTVGYIELGRKRPTQKTARRLAKALGVSLRALRPGSEG